MYQLADKLKERRTKLYPEEKLYNDGASSAGLDIDEEDEMIAIDTDRRKNNKSEGPFNLESEKRLGDAGSSQVLD